MYCYTLPSRLLIIGGTEIQSSEGTTQGDPVAMPIYVLSVIPLMLMVLEIGVIQKVHSSCGGWEEGGSLKSELKLTGGGGSSLSVR